MRSKAGNPKFGRHPELKCKLTFANPKIGRHPESELRSHSHGQIIDEIRRMMAIPTRKLRSHFHDSQQ